MSSQLSREELRRQRLLALERQGPAQVAVPDPKAAREQLRSQLRLANVPDEAIPEDYKCAISLDIMMDPVCCADGHTYERRELLAWFACGHKTSPKNNTVLENTNITDNKLVKTMISDWVDKRCKAAGVAREDDECVIIDERSAHQRAAAGARLAVDLTQDDDEGGEPLLFDVPVHRLSPGTSRGPFFSPLARSRFSHQSLSRAPPWKGHGGR